MKWLGLLLMAVGLVGSVALYDMYVPVYVTANSPIPGSDVFRQDSFYLSASLPMVCVFIGGVVLFLTGRRLARNSTQSWPTTRNRTVLRGKAVVNQGASHGLRRA